jgi:hypothetical protein
MQARGRFYFVVKTRNKVKIDYIICGRGGGQDVLRERLGRQDIWSFGGGYQAALESRGYCDEAGVLNGADLRTRKIITVKRSAPAVFIASVLRVGRKFLPASSF